MIALVDADIVAYRCAASAEKDSVEIACIRANRLLQDITSVTDASEVKLFLSGSVNFRKELYPEYKANRVKMVRPIHLESVREYLILEWSASVSHGYEADDSIGIEMGLAGPKEGICCSMDKDLKQIPGKHYNFVTGEFSDIDVHEGWRAFYTQCLTGDVADNVPGVGGIGKVRSARLLEGLSEYGMYEAVKKAYNDDKTFLRNARLLYIWRKENDDYLTHQMRLEAMSEERPEAVAKLESTVTMQEAISPFTEHGGTKQKKGGSRQRGRSKASASLKKRRAR